MIGLQRIGIKTFENENIFQIASPKKKDEYILRNVTGLTGSNLNVNYQKTLYSGSVHMGSRREEREITLLLELNPDRSKGSTAEKLRDDIYRHIISDELVDKYTRITLYGSKMDLYTEGRVSQIEADLYSQKPMIQVSFMCRYAHFIKTTQEVLDTATVNDISNQLVWTITNPGAPVGFTVTGRSDTQFSSFRVSNETNGQSISVGGAPDIEGTSWMFEIDTTAENRKIHKKGLRDGEWYFRSLYDKASIPNGYVQLESGKNVLSVNIFGVAPKIFNLKYTQRFNGI